MFAGSRSLQATPGAALCSLTLLLCLPVPMPGQGERVPEATGSRSQAVAAGSAARVQPGAAVQTAMVRAFADGAIHAAGPYRITPERRALLNTIRFAEGTWTGGRHDGYRMIYGGRLVADLSRHPEITVRSRYTSAAAGAYQFLPRTWQEAARLLRLPDFGPASQDQAALYLVEKRGVLQRFDRQGLCRELLARLAPEWASLPSRSGQSYYGQPVHDAEELLRFYNSQLARERAAGIDPQAG